MPATTHYRGYRITRVPSDRTQTEAEWGYARNTHYATYRGTEYIGDTVTLFGAKLMINNNDGYGASALSLPSANLYPVILVLLAVAASAMLAGLSLMGVI